MSSQKISAQEKQWQAEDDARTLKRAHEIMKDSGRMKMAKSQIQKEMDAMMGVAKIAGVSLNKKNTPKTTTTKKATTKKSGGKKK